jgi:putative tricarboxylic transport membrane protein
MYLGNLVGLFVILTTVPLFASILRIPFSIIAPVIIAICAIGAYTVGNSMHEVWFMLVFGIVGYVFKKLDYPLAPLVLALVLGAKAEDSFRQAMLVGGGEVWVLWSNPLVGSISTLALLMLFWPLIAKIMEKIRPAKKDEFADVRGVD